MMRSIPKWSADSTAFPEDFFLKCTSHPSITLAEVRDQRFCGSLNLQDFDQIYPPEENLKLIIRQPYGILKAKAGSHKTPKRWC